MTLQNIEVLKRDNQKYQGHRKSIQTPCWEGAGVNCQHTSRCGRKTCGLLDLIIDQMIAGCLEYPARKNSFA